MHPQKAPEPARLLAEARGLVASREYVHGRRVYLEILADYPESIEAFHARWGMAWIRIDPKSPLRNYAAAKINFDRLVERYGPRGGDWLAWVEAWRAVLGQLAECEQQGVELEDKARELKDDVVDLESNLDNLRQLEMNLELEP